MGKRQYAIDRARPRPSHRRRLDADRRRRRRHRSRSTRPHSPDRQLTILAPIGDNPPRTAEPCRYNSLHDNLLTATVVHPYLYAVGDRIISTGPHGVHPTAEASAAVDVEASAVGRTPTVPVDRVYGSFPLMGIDPDGDRWEGYRVDLRDVEARRYGVDRRRSGKDGGMRGPGTTALVTVGVQASAVGL